MLHTSNISIHNHRPQDNSSVSSNSSKSSYKHQTYLYTITGQRTTCPCRPTCPVQVKHIKHIYTQSQARRQLVRVVQLVQVKLQTSNISIHNHRPEDNSSVSSNSSKSSQKRNIHLNISIHNC